MMPGISPIAAILFSLSLAVSATAQQKVTIRKQLRSSVAIRADRRSAGSDAQVQVTEADIRMPGGDTVRRNIISVFDPGTGLFWWTYQNFDGQTTAASAQAMFLREYRVLPDKTRLVGFAAIDRSLWIRTASETFPNSDAATARLLATLGDKLQAIEADVNSGFKEVNLSRTLGVKFFLPAEPGDPVRGLRLTEVVRDANGWLVTVQNDAGAARTLVLDEAFRVAAVRGIE